MEQPNLKMDILLVLENLRVISLPSCCYSHSQFEFIVADVAFDPKSKMSQNAENIEKKMNRIKNLEKLSS